MAPDISHPFRDFIERITTGNVVSNDNTRAIAIITAYDVSKAFLASAVPYLEFHLFLTDREILSYEIDANRHAYVFRKKDYQQNEEAYNSYQLRIRQQLRV
jgi:hypothetical protein